MACLSRLQLYGLFILIAISALFYGYQSSNLYIMLFSLVFGSSLIPTTLLVTGQLRHRFKKQQEPPVDRASPEAKDVTIRIATVSPGNKDFMECLRGVFQNRPAGLQIVTGTRSEAEQARQIVKRLDTYGVPVGVASAGKADKRRQMIYRINDVKTPLITFVDDHAFLPEDFFKKVLPVFNDPDVVLCGTTKRVRREEPQVSGWFGIFKWYWKSYWNFAGAAYLAGHNTEFRAHEDLDGGHYVISGRTMLGRTAGFQDEKFQHKFLDEYRRFLWIKIGPLTAGDDNFITRWFSARWFSGRRVKIVFTDAATIETTLGESASKFILQNVRWVRTTFQNAGEIRESLQQKKPATALAILGMNLRGPLFWDCILVFLFQKSFEAHRWQHTACFLGFMWLTRLIKLVPYFLERPKDLIFLPAHLHFLYFHTLISLYSAVTIQSCSWSGRTLPEVKEEGTGWFEVGGAATEGEEIGD